MFLGADDGIYLLSSFVISTFIAWHTFLDEPYKPLSFLGVQTFIMFIHLFFLQMLALESVERVGSFTLRPDSRFLQRRQITFPFIQIIQCCFHQNIIR